MSNTPSRAPRVRLNDFFPVKDNKTQEQLGFLVDISESGMMLIANKSILVPLRLHIDIVSPKDQTDILLSLEAETVWCKINPNNQQHYGIGFSFKNLNTDTLNTLQNFLDEAPGKKH